MKVRYFVNAMVALEGKHTTVLCDPWVTFGNKAQNNFYNFPETDITPEDVTSVKPNYIYITHTHPDHFDPVTLSNFSRDTPIIISWYEENFTYRNIAALGFQDIRISDPEKGIALNNGDHCWLFPGTRYPEVDSVGVFEIDGTRLINLNDNPCAEDALLEIRERHAPFDVALVPFAGHGPYPMFYDNLSEAEKTEIATRRCQGAYEDFLNFIRILEPTYVVPFAGGLACGGNKALRYKFSGIGSRTGAVEFAEGKVDFRPVMLSPKMSYDFETGEYEGEFVEHTHDSDWDYMVELSKKPTRFDAGGSFWISPEEHTDLTRLLRGARAHQYKYQERRGVESDMVFFIDVGDEQLYRLSLADTEVSRVSEADIDDEYYEIFRLPYPLLIGLLTRHYIWSNIKTQYVNYYRKPDKYFQEIHTLMNYLQL